LGVAWQPMTRKKKKIVFSVAGGVLLLLLSLAAFAYYDFTHNFRIAFSPQQISDTQIALKGAMAEAIFNGQQEAEVISTSELKGKAGLDALFASTPTSNKGEGLIAAYQKDPQKFRRYAEMLDTAMNAKQVGDVVLKQDISRLPVTSESLPMATKLKVDAWGNPFCIIPLRGKVAVVSGGPSHLSCNKLPVSRDQIANSERNLYAAGDDVVVVIAQPTAASPTAQEKTNQYSQGFTGYPPSVYMHPFLACASDEPCSQTDKFHLNQVPTGCCVLIVTNGDGRGTDEVRTYELFLNGERVVPTDHSRTAQATVKLRPDNTLRVNLSGGPNSKIFVLLAYDPRQSK
jgi:hypothetical protein